MDLGDEYPMERGDIYLVNLNPIQGRERAGRQFVLIVSPREFNLLGAPLVCPITKGQLRARSKGFAVSLSGVGRKAQGVVLCNQLRALDLRKRGATFIERVPQVIVDEVIAKLLTLLE